MSIIYSKSVSGRQGVEFPVSDVPHTGDLIPKELSRACSAELCELSELDVVRHFTGLSNKNFGLDSNFYPLGSCTMKYNPKITEKIASLDGFVKLHPMLPHVGCNGEMVQGALAVLYHLERLLGEITGMDSFTTHPMAGAHGELTGMMIIAAYHKDRGNRKNEVLIPDEAHGTNPASAAMAGFDIVTIPSSGTGTLDIDSISSYIGEKTAAIMLTNPNTLGLFNPHVEKIARLAHKFDAQMYYDGANLNAIMGKFRPGDAGFDVMHVNLHKTFATPHGGGGPGAGPVGVKKHLLPYLPVPGIVITSSGTFELDYQRSKSIGYVAPFYGNFGVCLKAYCYILLMGRKGLIDASEHAVLNANYILSSLKKYFHVPYSGLCMHECVLNASRQLEYGIHTVDIAKRLMDYGFHPPTIYFPLIVKEAIMIEPTETESKETIDSFIEAMKTIAEEAKNSPEKLHNAPVLTPVRRLDETKAARTMDINYVG